MYTQYCSKLTEIESYENKELLSIKSLAHGKNYYAVTRIFVGANSF